MDVSRPLSAMDLLFESGKLTALLPNFCFLQLGPLFSISIKRGVSLSLAWLNDLISNMQNDATISSIAAPIAK